jgi:hypothetical protein
MTDSSTWNDLMAKLDAVTETLRHARENTPAEPPDQQTADSAREETPVAEPAESEQPAESPDQPAADNSQDKPQD